MSGRELAERLRRIPMFEDLDDEALARVGDLGTEFEVPEGQVLVERGQPGSGMFVITDGTVSVELPTGIVQVGPGEFVGELALLAEGVTHVARVRAATPVRGLAFGRGAFSNLLDREPKVAVAMLPVLARRLAEAESA